jgi:enoyl-CoA hydratase/carnithine racemase
MGTDTATTMYAAGEQSAQGLVDGLVLDQERLDKRAKELAEQMAKAIRKALRQAMKKGGGGGSGNGAGTLSLVPALAASSTAPAVPTATGRAASTSAAPGPTIIVNGAIDPEATARQIRRVLAGHDRRMGLAG